VGALGNETSKESLIETWLVAYPMKAKNTRILINKEHNECNLKNAINVT